MKRITVLIIALLFLIITNAGCGSIKGVGKDIEKAGEKIQESADKNSK
ncbi:MAG: hypothetical protein ACD_79C00025G0013 [uncultured bacterium]|nr:MAG: hypothetical protein ACD_79C00025G0013 [uncultured bacterium]